MSAVLTRRRRSGRGRERDHRQPSLFSQVVAPPARPDEARVEEPLVEATLAGETRVAVAEPVEAGEETTALSARTLDEAISALWGELVTGAAVDCPVCGSAMTPRHSAGAGVVGGRCGSCATTLA